MFDLNKIKGIIFDYGGTIDSNGKHWAEVLWEAYQDNKVPVTKEQFREAYVHVERHLAVNPLIKPEHHFGDLLKIKTDLQLEYLFANKYLSDSALLNQYSLGVSTQCYTFASDLIVKEISVIEQLYKKYPMVLVSNFYGNVQSVLANFKLDSYFGSIVESAVVGVRKPDPAIFALGIKEMSLPAENIVVIGDSHSKDIVPAQKNGCSTIWLKGLGWGDDEKDASADIIITDFMELKTVFQLD